MKNLQKSREKLLKLIVEHPDSCASLVRELSKSDAGLRKVALCLDLLGYTYARLLFSSILEKEWSELERMTRPLLSQISAKERLVVTHSIYMEFFSYCLGWMPDEKSQKGSFEFLRELNPKALEKLLSDEDSAEISLLAILMAPYEMTRIIENLPSAVGRQVISTMARFPRLPQDLLREQAVSYVERLREKLGKSRIAAAKAQEEINAAISSVNQDGEDAVLDLIGGEMPALQNILETQGYFETSKKLSKALRQN